MRFSVLFLFCLGQAALSAEDAWRDQLPERLMPELAPMIEAGLQNALEARDSSYGRRQAEAARIVGESAVLPTVSLSSTYRREQDFESAFGEDQRDRMIYFVTLSQPLYHWGAKNSEKKIGELLYEIGMIQADSASERIVSSARSAYMDMVLKKQERAIRKGVMERRREELQTARERSQQGLLSDEAVDLMGLELDRMELGWQKDTLEWERALFDFAYMLGEESEAIEARLRESIPAFVPLDSGQIASIRQSFGERVATDDDLQLQERAIAVDQERLNIERQALKPKFDAQLGLSLNPLEEDGVRREQEFAFLGLRVSWNIFDGFRAKGRRMEALARLERNQDAKFRLAEALERGYGQALDQLDLAGRALAIEERILERATQTFEKKEADRAAGRISENQFDAAEQEQAQAILGVQRQRVAYLKALSDLLLLLRVDPFIERQGH